MSAFRDRYNAPPLSPLSGEERTFCGSREGLGEVEDLRPWYGSTQDVWTHIEFRQMGGRSLSTARLAADVPEAVRQK